MSIKFQSLEKEAEHVKNLINHSYESNLFKMGGRYYYYFGVNYYPNEPIAAVNAIIIILIAVVAFIRVAMLILIEPIGKYSKRGTIYLLLIGFFMIQETANFKFVHYLLLQVLPNQFSFVESYHWNSSLIKSEMKTEILRKNILVFEIKYREEMERKFKRNNQNE